MACINPRQPMVRLFNERELDEIHLASLEILERTGLNVHHTEARESLVKAGARVDGMRARIPSHLVKRALETAPERIVLCARTGKRPVVSGVEGRRALQVALAIVEKIKPTK